MFFFSPCTMLSISIHHPMCNEHIADDQHQLQTWMSLGDELINQLGFMTFVLKPSYPVFLTHAWQTIWRCETVLSFLKLMAQLGWGIRLWSISKFSKSRQVLDQLFQNAGEGNWRIFQPLNNLPGKYRRRSKILRPKYESPAWNIPDFQGMGKFFKHC
jgi:hypothetical protein